MQELLVAALFACSVASLGLLVLTHVCVLLRTARDAPPEVAVPPVTVLKPLQPDANFSTSGRLSSRIGRYVAFCCR